VVAEVEFETEEGGTVKPVRFVDEMDQISSIRRESVSQSTPDTAYDLDHSIHANRGVSRERLIETMEASVELPGIVAQLNYLSLLQETRDG
jgi:hypothetical protein